MAALETNTPPPSASTQTSNSTPPPPQVPYTSPHRLGMPFDRRLLLAAFTSFTCGFTLGSTTAGRLASLRFRAENAHRLPISQPGWYLYHKSKNYYKMRHGITAGIRSGIYLATWASIFFIIEESMDIFRGTWRAGRTLDEMEGIDELDIRRIDRGVEKSRDFLSSAGAGMVVGGLWSAWNAFPMGTAARTIRLGLLAGLGYGLAQDGLVYLRRRGVGVVDEGESWLYRGARNRNRNEEGEKEKE